MKSDRPSKAPRRKAEPLSGRIHPVVIYPFRQPAQYTDLEAIYGLVAQLAQDPQHYARPITVIDRKTTRLAQKDPRFNTFRKDVVAQHSEVIDAWCVDTCQMWYTGLGASFDQAKPGDVHWLIPGDFNYGTAVGHDVLSRLHDLPEIILDLDQDICIGEIATDHNNSKQLIDTYGTFSLLYNWFPSEAQEIRRFTERPRSEFFAIRHSFLDEVLAQRWYPYEQTVVMLLNAASNRKRISRFFVGDITDLPEGRESLTSAVQQVERTERVLKSLWRDRNQSRKNWAELYRHLESRSERVVRTALSILGNLLT